jgi:hypothetical protein
MIQNRKSFSYNPDKDESFQAASDAAMSAVSRAAARRNMLYSDSNKAQMGQASMALVPQFEAAAYNKYQQEGNDLTTLLTSLQGLENKAYGQYRDKVGDIVDADQTAYDRGRDAKADMDAEITAAKADKANLENRERTDFLNTIGQYGENYQARINEIANDGDPSNDYQISYLKIARQEKIANQKAAEEKAAVAKTEAEAQMYKDTLELWKEYGVATQQIADIIGVPVGAVTADYDVKSLNALISQANAETSRMNAETARINAEKTKSDGQASERVNQLFTLMMQNPNPEQWLEYSAGQGLTVDEYKALKAMLPKVEEKKSTFTTDDYVKQAQAMLNADTVTPIAGKDAEFTKRFNAIDYLRNMTINKNISEDDLNSALDLLNISDADVDEYMRIKFPTQAAGGR